MAEELEANAWLPCLLVVNEKALPLIWHEPLMAANATTYAGGMISCLGFDVVNIDPDGNGYPVVIACHRYSRAWYVAHLFFSSEPHEFNPSGRQSTVADEVERIGGRRPQVAPHRRRSAHVDGQPHECGT